MINTSLLFEHNARSSGWADTGAYYHALHSALCVCPRIAQLTTRNEPTRQSSSGVKVTTPSISVASQKSITRRSTPSALPPASGMSFKAFKNFCGIG